MSTPYEDFWAMLGLGNFFNPKYNGQGLIPTSPGNYDLRRAALMQQAMQAQSGAPKAPRRKQAQQPADSSPQAAAMREAIQGAQGVPVQTPRSQTIKQQQAAVAPPPVQLLPSRQQTRAAAATADAIKSVTPFAASYTPGETMQSRAAEQAEGEAMYQRVLAQASRPEDYVQDPKGSSNLPMGAEFGTEQQTAPATNEEWKNGVFYREAMAARDANARNAVNQLLRPPPGARNSKSGYHLGDGYNLATRPLANHEDASAVGYNPRVRKGDYYGPENEGKTWGRFGKQYNNQEVMDLNGRIVPVTRESPNSGVMYIPGTAENRASVAAERKEQAAAQRRNNERFKKSLY